MIFKEPGLVILPSETLSQLDRMRLHMYFGHECNRRNVNNLLDSCKMTLQDKGKKEKVDKDKDEEKEEESHEEENNEDDDFGNKKVVEFVFESNENLNNSREDDLGEQSGDDRIKLNKKQIKDKDPNFGQFVDPNENENTDLEKETDVKNENSNEKQNESIGKSSNDNKMKMSGVNIMFPPDDYFHDTDD